MGSLSRFPVIPLASSSPSLPCSTHRQTHHTTKGAAVFDSNGIVGGSSASLSGHSLGVVEQVDLGGQAAVAGHSVV